MEKYRSENSQPFTDIYIVSFFILAEEARDLNVSYL